MTLEHLHVTGADYGVYAGNNSDSDGLTIVRCEIYGNDRGGVYLYTSNDRAELLENKLYAIPGDSGDDNQNTGIHILGIKAIVTGNTIYNHGGAGIDVGGARSLIDGNEAYGNSMGIRVYDWASESIVSNNVVHDNTSKGIDAYTQGNKAIVIGNEVFGHNGSGDQGIYSNTADVIGNVVYANTNRGILLWKANPAEVINNTVFEPVGDALRVDNSSRDVTLRNNILWVNAGHDIYVVSNSRTGFDSDYNGNRLGRRLERPAHGYRKLRSGRRSRQTQFGLSGIRRNRLRRQSFRRDRHGQGLARQRQLLEFYPSLPVPLLRSDVRHGQSDQQWPAAF